MSDYPEFREFVEGFAGRYTLTTDLGPVVMVMREELEELARFLRSVAMNADQRELHINRGLGNE